MSQRVIAAALLLAAICAGCKRAPEPAKPAPAPPNYDRLNLLDLSRGVVVLSRTGESNLDAGAVQTIDDNANTGWVSPAEGQQQTITYELAGRSRIRTLGATTVRTMLTDRIVFEGSADGVTFRPLGTLETKAIGGVQTIDIAPAEVSVLRVQTSGAPRYISIRDLYAVGDALEPARPGNIDGCWTINNRPAKFVTQGGVTRGVIGSAPPVELEGGSDGRMFRFAFSQAGAYGMAAFTVARNGNTLSGLRWYEVANPMHSGDGFYGTRTDCRIASFDTRGPLTNHLRNGKPFPLYGLHFDANDHLDVAGSAYALDLLAAFAKSQKMRVRAHEPSDGTEAQNEAHARAWLESVRSALAARGVDVSRIELTTAGPGPVPATTSEVIRAMGRTVYVEFAK